MSLGWLSAIVHNPSRLTAEQRSGRVLTGRVADLQYTDFSMRLTIDVIDDDLPPCRILLSTRGCDYNMQPGDIVAWKGNLSEIHSLGNPDEMDYAAYLMDAQGLRYQQHLPLNQVVKVGWSPTLSTRLASVRRNLSLMVFNSRLSPHAGRMVTALLLGNSRHIDQATRQEFSAAGIAHVLALSGLHVGFIALVIWWLLFPLDYLGLKKVRLIVTLGCIAVYAVFTGLSPSVVRATVMIACVVASTLFSRRASSLNALAVAALAILIFSPSSLYSVGFQLSFITVAAVLLFASVSERFKSRYRWVNYLSSTATTSIVAMLATVALTAHYFHTVSLMSVFTNLLVLPVMPVLMVLGAIFLLVTAGGGHWQVLDTAIDGIDRYIHGAARMVNAIPGSHVSGVYVSSMGVAIWFIIMALIGLWLYRRNYRWLLAAACATVVLLAHSLWLDAHTPQRGLVIFNAYSSTPLLYFEAGKGYVWTPDDEQNDSSAFAHIHAGFLARHGINELVMVQGDTVLDLNGAFFKPPYAYLMGRRVIAVGSGRWKNATVDNPMQLDDIIVTKRFHGNAAILKELYRFERLVISGAMHDAAPLIHECDSLDVPYINLADGALVIDTSTTPP